MLFTRLAFFALPILSAFAAPAVEPKGLLAPQDPSKAIVSVLGQLQTNIAAPLKLLNTQDSVNLYNLNVSSVPSALSDLELYLGNALNNLNSIKTPSKGLVPFVSGLLGGNNQANTEVTAFLAEIYKQIQTGILRTTKDVQQEPKIAKLLSSIGVKLGGLTTKIDGLLPGVVTLLKKLLGGSGGLLSTSSGSNNFFTSLKSALGIK